MLKSVDDHCSRSEDLREALTRIKSLEKEVDGLKKYVIANAEARIYSSGLEDGKKAVNGRLYRIINVSVIFVGTVVVLCVLGLIIYVLAGAEHAVNFFNVVFKFLGVK